MVGKGDERLKSVVDITANLLNIINEVDKKGEENASLSATLRRSNSLPPHGSVTASHKRGASTSTTEEAPPAIKKLLETWLTSILSDILDKPVQRANENVIQADITTTADEQPTPPTGNTYTVVDAGNDALSAILKKIEEMETENKVIRDQMKEHQERVDKIPGIPKLLPKRDVIRFVKQLYSEEVAPHVIPKTFKMSPYLKIYDGTTDPEDHIINYVTAVKGNDLSKEQVPSVLLKKFGETSIRGSLTWYS